MSNPIKILFLLFVALLAYVEPAAADEEFLEHYKAGLSAIHAENWSRAAQLMQFAIHQRGREARRLPRYIYLKPYLPHFYLGLARFKQGDCNGAIQAWGISERQGVIQRRPQYQQIELAKELCRSQQVQRPTKPPEAQRQPPNQPTTVEAPQPAEKSRKVTSKKSPPKKPAQKAGTPSKVDKPIRQATAPTPEKQGDEPLPTSHSFPPPATPPADSYQTKKIEKPIAPPSDLLVKSAEAFLNGSYTKAIDLLLGKIEIPGETVPDPYSYAHEQLVLAAAEFALYLVSGESEDDRLEAARAAVLDVRLLLPSLELPERYFSPRFLDFFYGQRPEEVR